MRKWDRARDKILTPFGLLDRIIMMSSQDISDMRQLEDSMPLDIVKYFVSRMIKMN